MEKIEIMYFEKEQNDIKECSQKIKYNGKNYYLFEERIYDEDFNLLIDCAENGFLDLYEYFEYFPQNGD